MTRRAYLAGPDVFLRDAASHAARKRAICARHGIEGLSPLNEDAASLDTLPAAEGWRAIFDKDVAMMEGCDLVIANLTPYAGVSADAGTLVELGWFLGRGRPAFGYTNSARPFAERAERHVARMGAPMPGLGVERFGLPDNLMVEGALVASSGHGTVRPPGGADLPFDSLEAFEACVALAARRLAS